MNANNINVETWGDKKFSITVYKKGVKLCVAKFDFEEEILAYELRDYLRNNLDILASWLIMNGA